MDLNFLQKITPNLSGILWISPSNGINKEQPYEQEINYILNNHVHLFRTHHAESFQQRPTLFVSTHYQHSPFMVFHTDDQHLVKKVETLVPLLKATNTEDGVKEVGLLGSDQKMHKHLQDHFAKKLKFFTLS